MSSPPRPATPLVRQRVLLRGGAALVLLGLAVLLVARSTLSQAVYVSEMGAAGMPTSTAFSTALLLVAAGGAMVAVASRSVRSRVRLLSRWLPSTSILVASVCFAFSSQVTCTAGCPLPVGATFTWQDLLHTSAAVIGFAAACVAMLQVASAEAQPRVARLSLWAGTLVALIAGAGAILSLLRMSMGVGGALEFVATAIAILWLAAYGLALSGITAVPTRRTARRGSRRAGARFPHPEPAPSPILQPEER